ncbi:MAG: hypothetical protein ACREQV_09850, partial [Candidatus Binatia bacterium]
MPPADQPKANPVILLLDEIETLSAQTRLLEMSLKRAHADAFDEAERLQQQFRAKITSLKAEFEAKENKFSEPRTLIRHDGGPLDIQNEDLLRRFAEQQNLIQREHEESERRGAAIVALRQQLSHLKAANRDLPEAAAQHGEQAAREPGSQVSDLQNELAQKQHTLQRLQTSLSETQQSAQTNLCRLEEELASSRDLADRQRREIERDQGERNELRQRVAELESAEEQVQAQAARDLELVGQDTQAKIAALQSEIAHKTALLTQNQTTIARLEQESRAISASAQS